MTVLAQTHIVATPDTCFGKPRIDGHRIRVQDVAVWIAYQQRTVEDIAESFSLTLAGVYSAMAYYYDHRDEIDDAIRIESDAIEEGAKRNPDKIRALFGE